MIITRLGNEREMKKIVDVIDILIDGQEFRLHDINGKLQVMAISTKLNIRPCVSNVIELSSED